MPASGIPWDSPSRWGTAGVLARRALRRVVRPVTVRTDDQLQRVRNELSALRREQSALIDELRRAKAYGAAVDDVIDTLLVRELAPGTRHRAVGTGACSRVICSMATGPYRPLMGRSALSFERYAERWGWDLVLSTEDLAEGRPAPWGKVPLIRSLLDDYEWVLWLDADVVVVDLAADISEVIQADKDLYLVEHQWLGQYTANSGMFLLRSSEWSRAFLDEVWAIDQHVGHPWWENGAFLHLLGYGSEPARLVEPSAWLGRTKLIDQRWNSIELERSDRPAFIHRGFYDVHTRSRQVTGDLACALGSADPLTAGWERPARRITAVPDVCRREELPLLLNALGLIGPGIELGVFKGKFSEHILEHWDGGRLFSIDPWRAAPADRYIDISNVSQDEQDANHAETCRRLARFGSRSEVWRAAGAEAVSSFPPECLDFVYLDARHDERSVREDLAAWWPLVRPTGVIAGHDYLDGVRPEGVFGVRSAVDAFFGELGIPVHVTVDDDPWPTWIAVKPA